MCSFYVAIYGVYNAGCSVAAKVDGTQAGLPNPVIIAGCQYAYFDCQLPFLSSASANLNVSRNSEASAVVVMVRAFTMWKAKGGPESESWCARLTCMSLVLLFYTYARSLVVTVMHFRLSPANAPFCFV